MRDFDELLDLRLSEDVGGLPPGPGEVEEFSPFGFAVLYLVAGLAMQTITLNFFNLQYILPMFGSILLYLGFRSLRRENRWFTACYVISALRLVQTWALDILLATPLAPSLQTVTVRPPLSLLLLLVPLAFFLCFRQGLRGLWRRQGKKPDGDPMLWACVWYAALVVLAYVGAGTVLSLGALVWWILILRALWRAGQSLEQVGYALELALVRLSRRTVTLGVLALTLLPIVVLSLWFARSTVDCQPRDPAETQTHAALRQELEDLGFPAEILADLAPEDLAGYEGTISVYSDREELSQGGSLELVTVYAVTSEQSVRVLHWFHWSKMPMLRLGDVLQCNLPMSSVEPLDDRYENLTGRVLYDRGKTAYTGPFAALDWSSEEVMSWWGDVVTEVKFEARPSLPLLANHARGYVVYDYLHGPDKKVDGLAFSYFHQTAPVLYPWQEPASSPFGGGPYRRLCNYSNLYTYRGLEELGRPPEE